MKRILYIITVLFIIFSCGISRKNNIKESTSRMILLIDTTFTRHQLDSLCFADTISNELNTWEKVMFIDYETNEKIIEYLFIKQLNEDEVMYRVIIEKESYKIIKRLTDN